MDKVKDQLLRDLMEEHGAALAVAEPPAAHRNTRPVWVAAGAVALAGAIFAAVSLTSGGSPAFAITKSPDGKVEVKVPDDSGIDPANKELERLGLPIRVVLSRLDCPQPPGPPARRLRPEFVPTTTREITGWRFNLADIHPGETALLMRGTFPEGLQFFAFEVVTTGIPLPKCVSPVLAPRGLPSPLAPVPTTHR
jgi:hypothetical protein